MRSYAARKRMLVTGGAWFTGSHTVDKLLARDHEVTCLDNVFTGIGRNFGEPHSNPSARRDRLTDSRSPA